MSQAIHKQPCGVSVAVYDGDYFHGEVVQVGEEIDFCLWDAPCWKELEVGK